MKLNTMILTAGWMVLGLTWNVSASIVTYDFQGKVTSLTRDVHIVDGLIAVGDSVEFTFEVDLNSPGSIVRYNGQKIEWVDHDNEAEKVDHFWTRYIGGSDIGPIGEITVPDPNLYETWNYGLSVKRKVDGVIVQDTGYLYGGSSYNWVSIENYSRNAQDWEQGSSGFSFRHIVMNQGGEDVWIRGTLALVGKSSLAAVPEPSTAITAIALGLVVFVLVRNRLGR